MAGEGSRIWGLVEVDGDVRRYLCMFRMDFARNDGQPRTDWILDPRGALRLTRPQASGAALLLDMPDNVRIEKLP